MCLLPQRANISAISKTITFYRIIGFDVWGIDNPKSSNFCKGPNRGALVHGNY